MLDIITSYIGLYTGLIVVPFISVCTFFYKKIVANEDSISNIDSYNTKNTLEHEMLQKDITEIKMDISKLEKSLENKATKEDIKSVKESFSEAVCDMKNIFLPIIQQLELEKMKRRKK